jgi:hypothetical protein
MFMDVKVKLIGEDGNAFAIMGRVSKAMRRAGKTDDEIKSVMDKMTEGDYDNLLSYVTMNFEVE